MEGVERELTTDGGCVGQTVFAPLEPSVVRAVVGRIDEILPLPGVVNALLKAASDPYTSLAKVADIILTDQGLTAKVLKIINSAYYGLSRPVVTVTQAVNLLGLDKIKSLAMAVSLADRLYHYSGLPFGRRGLYQHSQACGVATQLVAQGSGYPIPEEALIAGLLHDIAKALWGEVFPERLVAALNAMGWQGLAPEEAEKEFLTVDHATVGSWMLARWQLPPIFQRAVRHHHQREAHLPEPRARLLSRCLYVGNILAKLLNLGHGGHFRLSALPSELFQALHLHRGQLAALLRAVPGALHEFVKELELEPADDQHLRVLVKALAGRPVYIWGEGEEKGPVSLFLEAFVSDVNEVHGGQWPGDTWSPRAVFFWEGEDHAAILEQWRCLDPRPQARLLLFCHTGGSPHAASLPVAEGIHLLGPDWRLEEVTTAIAPSSRP